MIHCRTEPHNPWQNPVKLIGVKYLKSHSQVPHVHNLTANIELNCKVSEQVSGKGRDIRHIPYPDVLLV
jgi:hypothetical protein